MNTMKDELKNKVLLIDGAMGTLLHQSSLKATCSELCVDHLCIENPELVAHIHIKYIEAGADIITTNTFNANAAGQALLSHSYSVKELNDKAVRIAKESAARAYENCGRKAFIVGDLGPSLISLSNSKSNINNVFTFSMLSQAYCEQAIILLESGVDALLLETIIDMQNANAALEGITRAFCIFGRNVPLMLSFTILETGRLLSGENISDILAQCKDIETISIGLNCCNDIHATLLHIKEMQSLKCAVSLMPNAGLLDDCGNYPPTKHIIDTLIKPLLANNELNIIGGCCGTTPDFLSEIALLAKNSLPRKIML